MIPSPSVGTAQGPLADLALRYEELRSHCFEKQVGGNRQGLVLLLRGGLAAWVEGHLQLPAAMSVTREQGSASQVLPEAMSADVVNLLTAMAVSHFQEAMA